MIANDPRRSMEFFKNPVDAGRAARAMPLEVGQILAIHALRAILLGIFSYLTYENISQGVDISASDPTSLQISYQINAILNEIYTSPLTLTTLSFVSSLLMTTFYWQIGRALSGNKISWVEAQSGLMRYLIVAALISVVPNIFELVFGASFFVLFGLILSIYLFVIMLRVLQGVMDLSGIGQAIATVFLSFLAMAGVIFVFSLFLSIGL